MTKTLIQKDRAKGVLLGSVVEGPTKVSAWGFRDIGVWGLGGLGV